MKRMYVSMTATNPVLQRTIITQHLQTIGFLSPKKNEPLLCDSTESSIPLFAAARR